MRKRNLLIDEYPLLVLPSLAKSIGLNEAIALQQLHYWLENPKGGVELDGERWVYNTYEDWQKDNFPFWSVSTVKRVFANLEEMGLVVSTQQASYDRKKYYRVHYVNLTQWNDSDRDNPEFQNDPMDSVKVVRSLTETTTKTTQRGKGAALDFKSMTVSQARKLPTIKLYTDATDFFPGSVIWEYVHETILENNLTFEKLHAAAVEWGARGYKPENVKGILEWAVNGIPAGKNAPAPAAQTVDKFASLYDYLDRQESQS